ncbi:hypothetical protein AEB_P0945 [Altererythrobacter sp. B11]|nr:hypothetical protein AEB_P0945 [Altererythrobacter sp. B11]
MQRPQAEEASAPAAPPAPPPVAQQERPRFVARPAPEPELAKSQTTPPAPPAPRVAEEVAVPPPPMQPAAYGDAGPQFDAAPPFRRRRNVLRLWTWAAVAFALLAGGLTVAVSYWGVPDWVPVSRPIFGAAQPDLQLDFPAEKQERRQLPNGTEFFGASGTITNIGSSAHDVPPILIVLRDEQDRIVYSWEVMPPKRSLAPGESVSVNEAVTDVPRRAKSAEIGWKPE